MEKGDQMEFQNSYEDDRRAEAYDELQFGGTYHLAFDGLPEILKKSVTGKTALDFGCGTGRSSRYLKGLGFGVTGIDISDEMVAIARKRDLSGDYRVIEDGDFSSLEKSHFDLILSAFTFDNIPTRENKVRLFTGLGRLLAPEGRIVSIVSTPEIYTNEWVTFSTREFPENRDAGCGDTVKIITRDYSDARPVEDVVWPDEDYQSVYLDSGLEQVSSVAPLASGDEGIDWVSETKIAPWRIYVLRSDPRSI
jgi:SAM-dependent methyltransferase